MSAQLSGGGMAPNLLQSDVGLQLITSDLTLLLAVPQRLFANIDYNLS